MRQILASRGFRLAGAIVVTAIVVASILTFRRAPRRVAGGDPPELLGYLEGAGADDEFGSCLAAFPDLDGDGAGEILVGAPYDDAAAEDAGAIALFSGRSRTRLWRLEGERREDFLGECVAAVGDLDGDGFPEAAAGARGRPGSKGSVHLVSGRDGRRLATIDGHRADEEFGHTAVALPDLDGDGVGEIAIAAPGTWRGKIAGRVWLHSGRGGALIREIAGANVDGDRFGFAMSLVADLDGDGSRDLAVGSLGDAAKGPHTGSVRIFSCRSGAELARFEGREAGDEFGHATAYLPPREGLPMGALAIGAFRQQGKGYVLVIDLATRAPIFECRGTDAGDAFGHTVAVSADTVGDGFADLVVGSPDAAHPVAGYAAVGRIEIFSGKDGARIGRHDGRLERAHLGYALACPGDLDGDGLGDVVAGTTMGDGQRGVALVVGPVRMAR